MKYTNTKNPEFSGLVKKGKNLRGVWLDAGVNLEIFDEWDEVMKKDKSGIWLITLLVGVATIGFSLPQPPNFFAWGFLIAGFVTIIFLLQKIHELETEIERMQQPNKWL